MPHLYHFKDYYHRPLAELTLAETLELETLEKVVPSLSEWDAYAMLPISEREKRWAFLSQKYVDSQGEQVEATRRRDWSCERRSFPRYLSNYRFRLDHGRSDKVEKRES